MWGKSNPKPSQNTTVISFDCVCPSLGSIQLFHGGIENLLNRYATKVFVDRVFGCVSMVSIYFNKLPGELFFCLETTCVTRETQVARQINLGQYNVSFSSLHTRTQIAWFSGFVELQTRIFSRKLLRTSVVTTQTEINSNSTLPED